jgi:hypothetical protein
VGFRIDPCGFVWVFSFCGLALVVSVYILGVLRSALRFLIKSSYLSKKEKEKKKGRISWQEKGVVGSSCLHYVDNLTEEK